MSYPKYRLTYFNNRGRAEHCRLLFILAEVEFEDIRVDVKEWPEMKSSTPFGQLPVLFVQFEDGTSLEVCQSYAICRYLAKTFGLMGQNEIEALNIDVIVDCQEDFNRPLIAYARDLNKSTKEEKKKKFMEEQQEFYFDHFEELLKKNGTSGFFVGNKLTWADLAFYHGVSWADTFGMCTPWNKYPSLKSLKDKVENDYRLKAWFEKRPETPW